MNEKKVTIRDIARESGFSVATVSRYINKVSYTSPETEKKIQEVLDRFNYTPNAIARGLAKQKSNTIAFVTPDITNPFFPELVRSIGRVLKRSGYSLLLINTDEHELGTPEFWAHFKSRYIDGFILAESPASEDVEPDVHKLSIPYVRIDRAFHAGNNLSVGVNHFEGARIAARHLVDIGCRKIAHVSGPGSFWPAKERRAGYESIIAETGQSPIVFEGDFSLDGGREITEVLLREFPDVDGIFYANDLMAIGSLKVFKRKGLAIPEDVAIIGFDGIELAEIVQPEISTIRQPIEEIGESATKRLIAAIEHPNRVNDENVMLDVTLVQRESTRRD